MELSPTRVEVTGEFSSKDGDFLVSEAASTPDEAQGTHIGPYKLVLQIGEGGMGSVWLAEQHEPVRRSVALKVIRAGLAGSQAVARFESERQALAMMDHPNIARVFDGGTTAAGQPYFVMELVKGIPITSYCDDARLNTRQRLELFVSVCKAIQHAHQKGIIHRDIKPSNVLVAIYDGQPVVKVIDFGLAKATGKQLTGQSAITEFGAILGTLEYMSPEQADLAGHDVDTRSDIYSLGVLLYELLTGSTPLTKQRLQKATMLELLRVIREEEPPRPSTRLSSAGDTLKSISEHRQADPARLSRLIRGDLDWIVMKALDKDRERRYETANGFAQDIENYLNSRPVAACPPSAGYRLRKFVRRNRGAALAVSIVLLALLAGLAGTTWGLVRADRATQAEAERAEGERQAKIEADIARQAEAARAEGERLAKNEQIAERQKAEEASKKAIASEADTVAFSKFLVNDVLSAARPKGENGGLGIDVTVKQALIAASGKLGERFKGRPRAEAVARHDLGVTFRLIGDSVRAVEQLEKAHSLRKQISGDNSFETLDAANSLGVAYSHAGMFDKAIALGEETLRLTEAKNGPRHRETLQAMKNLSISYFEGGQKQKGMELIKKAVAIHRQDSGTKRPDTVDCIGVLATQYQMTGNLPLALPLLKEVFEFQREHHGADHTTTLATMGNLAAAYWKLKKYDQAVPMFEQALELRTKKQGEDHPETLFVAFNLAVNYVDAGKKDKAVATMKSALPKAQKSLQPGHPTRDFGTEIGVYVFQHAGLLSDAEPLLREQLERAERTSGPSSTDCAVALAQLGGNLIQQREWTKSEPILRRSLAIRERVEPVAWTTHYARSQLGYALLGMKKYADAEPLLLSGYENLKRILGNNSTRVSANSAMANSFNETGARVVQLYEAWGKKELAEEWRKKLSEVR